MGAGASGAAGCVCPPDGAFPLRPEILARGRRPGPRIARLRGRLQPALQLVDQRRLAVDDLARVGRIRLQLRAQPVVVGPASVRASWRSSRICVSIPPSLASERRVQTFSAASGPAISASIPLCGAALLAARPCPARRRPRPATPRQRPRTAAAGAGEPPRDRLVSARALIAGRQRLRSPPPRGAHPTGRCPGRPARARRPGRRPAGRRWSRRGQRTRPRPRTHRTGGLEDDAPPSRGPRQVSMSVREAARYPGCRLVPLPRCCTPAASPALPRRAPAAPAPRGAACPGPRSGDRTLPPQRRPRRFPPAPGRASALRIRICAESRTAGVSVSR